MEDFRVLITEKCNANCPNCFNKNIRKNNEMSISDFKKVCDYLSKEGGVRKLKIMGGEPTVHPDFLECVEYAQLCFDSVHIFTNALNDKIKDVKLRDKDSVIYNVSCLGTNVDTTKFLLNQKGGRMFETQISHETDIEKLQKVLMLIRDNIPDDRMSVALTLNCVENIYENKVCIIEKWNQMVVFLQEKLNILHNIDHNIPYCFFVGSDMKIKVKNSKCSTKCAGLITPSLKLQYCNQSQEILQDVIVDGNFIPFEIIENRLQSYYYHKMLKNYNKICKNCIFFEKKCNGGCFVHKDIITNRSIIKATDLPIM